MTRAQLLAQLQDPRNGNLGAVGVALVAAGKRSRAVIVPTS